MLKKLVSYWAVALISLGTCDVPYPAYSQFGEELSEIGDDIQDAATAGKNTGQHIGNDVAPVTDPIGDALHPVGDAVAPVTEPVGESTDRIYHDASSLVGEGHAPKGGEAAIKNGVKCATARQDIKTLQSEKAGVGRQIMAGVSSVFPMSAVIGLLKGNYAENVQVSAGQYNRDIDHKIAQIRQVCGVS
jgi:hypothetical protein